MFEFADGRKAFSQLMGLADIVMCLPNSNAKCERQFAIMTDVKAKKRNRMDYPLLSSIIIIKSALKARKETFLTFQVTKEDIVYPTGKLLHFRINHLTFDTSFRYNFLRFISRFDTKYFDQK